MNNIVNIHMTIDRPIFIDEKFKNIDYNEHMSYVNEEGKNTKIEIEKLEIENLNCRSFFKINKYIQIKYKTYGNKIIKYTQAYNTCIFYFNIISENIVELLDYNYMYNKMYMKDFSIYGIRDMFEADIDLDNNLTVNLILVI